MRNVFNHNFATLKELSQTSYSFCNVINLISSGHCTAKFGMLFCLWFSVSSLQYNTAYVCVLTSCEHQLIAPSKSYNLEIYKPNKLVPIMPPIIYHTLKVIYVIVNIGNLLIIIKRQIGYR